ncbi:MAG: GNAT family N-acetyltransferase [Clostridia bacterium]|nr:GNAT family N-acetyltransferase [Clostridia bacterium]
MITYKHEIPTETYLDMREGAGWRRPSLEQGEVSLKNTSYLVSAWDGDKPVGMARVVSDMGYMYVLADVIVIPEYQGQGIGRGLIEHIEEWLAEQKKKYPTIMIDVMAALGKSGFYEKFGYNLRTDENHTGYGLSKWLDD